MLKSVIYLPKPRGDVDVVFDGIYPFLRDLNITTQFRQIYNTL